MSGLSQAGWWAAFTMVWQMAFLIAVDVLYMASGDICDPLHESPNTPVGWTAAAFAIAVPIGLAAWFRTRTMLLVSVASIAPLFLFWLWWLLPSGHCTG